MSVVTNIILACSSSDKATSILPQLEHFSYLGKPFSITSVKDKNLPSNWYGGDKVLECNIFIGAYNHFPLDEFVTYLKENVRWEDIETVQLFVKTQDEDRFRIINLVEDI